MTNEPILEVHLSLNITNCDLRNRLCFSLQDDMFKHNLKYCTSLGTLQCSTGSKKM